MSNDQCDLAAKQCVPCQGGVPALQGEELERLQAQLGGDWRVVDGHHLEREYRFDDFQSALDVTVRIGEIAEREGHHPDLGLGWGYVRVSIFTHKVDGLTESDFILAAKIEALSQAGARAS
jgi:4a-hydroxytetrahydrobiopterin dehydratase